MYRRILKKSALCFKFDPDLDHFLKTCTRMRFDDYQHEKKLDYIRLSIFQGQELNKILSLILHRDRNVGFEHPLLVSIQPQELISKFFSELIDLAYGQKPKLQTLTGFVFNSNRFDFINSEFTFYANRNINSIVFQEFSNRLNIHKFKEVTPIPQFLADHIESNVLNNLQSCCNYLSKQTIESIRSKYRSLL